MDTCKSNEDLSRERNHEGKKETFQLSGLQIGVLGNSLGHAAAKWLPGKVEAEAGLERKDGWGIAGAALG